MSNWHDAISAADLTPASTGPIVYSIKCSRCGNWFEYDSDTGLCETCEQEATVHEQRHAEQAASAASHDDPRR